jgi:hypothetical protein
VTPEKPRWPGEGPPPRPKPKQEWVVARMRHHYQKLCEDAIQEADARTGDGLRMRADGSPSAVPPQATLPVELWATVQELPDGGDGEGVPERLHWYREWLRRLQKNGLYDGPTELKRVNDD